MQFIYDCLVKFDNLQFVPLVSICEMDTIKILNHLDVSNLFISDGCVRHFGSFLSKYILPINFDFKQYCILISFK